MQPNNVTIIYMKHFSFLLGLIVAFTSLFVSCSEDEKDSTVCTVTVKGVGHGTVSITRYIGTSADVLIGSLVEVAATPDDGYAFTGWYTDESETPVSTNPFFEFVAMEDITLTARFAELSNITISGTEGGRVSFEDRAGTSIAVLPGTEVTVVATPYDGFAFTGWYADESEIPVSTDSMFVFVATEDIALTARFTEYLHVTISATNGGDVAFKDISKFNHIWDTEIAVLPGTEVTVIATPDEGAEFAGWFVGDTVVCTETEYTFIVNEYVDLIARFIMVINGHECVDLGLPSGLKWACCNVGASEPWEYGGYYAWGETEEKSNYTWKKYKWCNGSEDSMTKYCTDSDYGRVDNKTVLDPADDVAHVKWGGSWRMPTLDEIRELVNRCNWQWTSLNGVNGYRVTGPNGNSIFLPAAGQRYRTGHLDRGTNGYYWSSSLYDPYYSYHAWGLDFYNDSHDWGVSDRYIGQSVRPVCE